jgi:5-methylcytosine-specific restriction protein A
MASSIRKNLSIPEDDFTEAAEGQLLTRMHRYRERNAAIVKRKKASYLKQHGHLCCEACGFDYQSHYCERGDSLIECHQAKPVSEPVTGEMTKLIDMVLLCANCHRMVHASRPWWTIEELRTAISRHTKSLVR